MLYNGSFGEDKVVVQHLARSGSTQHLRYCGREIDVKVIDARHKHLHTLMPEPSNEVNGDVVITPMPGVLDEVLVKVSSPKSARICHNFIIK